MTNVPTELFYTKDHEWIRQEPDGSCIVGITHHAQDSLGDVTFVEMPSTGQNFDRGSVFGVVESVKAASDLYMPLTGEIIEINEDLNDSPENVNNDPYTAGWLIKIKPSEEISMDDLLNSENYKKEIGES
ncbi:MAG: glycine cleavage system protein GcvH [Opitutae bacterium]|jgi:glycine cleavage system H protein|nr:glycine cleavage system protein GcvH [Opitutae bacterium]MBT5716128.1 glycine cleavage system protein GcvH [Opitutae bacterium]